MQCGLVDSTASTGNGKAVASAINCCYPALISF